MNGAQMIAYERERHKTVEGYTAQHDRQHCDLELTRAAECYIDAAKARVRGLLDYANKPFYWPFEDATWKPSPSAVKMLVKSGALLAAEIDRLLEEENNRHA